MNNINASEIDLLGSFPQPLTFNCSEVLLEEEDSITACALQATSTPLKSREKSLLVNQTEYFSSDGSQNETEFFASNSGIAVNLSEEGENNQDDTSSKTDEVEFRTIVNQTQPESRAENSLKTPPSDKEMKENFVKNDEFVGKHVLKEFRCCQSNCIEKVYAADKLDARRAFSQMKFTSRSEWILDTLRMFRPVRLESAEFYVAGIEVCTEAFRLIHGISRTKLYEVYQIYKNGYNILSPKKRQVRVRSKLKTNIAIAWMHVYFNRIGEKMPNRISINLPSYLTQQKIYMEMKEQLEQNKDPCCGFSWFCHLWNERFNNVNIPAEDRMSKCGICTILKEEREKTTDISVREYLDKLFHEHNRLQTEQRENYWKHREKARRNPNKYMSLIVDAMDHSKLVIPKFMKKSKETTNLERLRSHLTAVLDHGNDPLAFVGLFQWPHDSNYTINTLLSALEKHEKLPDFLYPQMDNCWRENKNQFVLSFLALLILLGVFTKIRVSFLMVGHTHEDVDQLFSRIKNWLIKNNLLTLAELLDGIKQAYTPTPRVELVKGVFDVRSWMEPVRKELHNIIYPHCFKLYKGVDGSIRMQYKNWCEDQWLPFAENGKPDSLEILEANAIPYGEPSLIIPSEDQQNLPKLKKDLAGYYRFSTLFKEEQKLQWEYLFAPNSDHFKLKSINWPLKSILEQKGKQIQEQEEEKRQKTASIIPNELLPNIIRPEGVSDLAETRIAAQIDSLPKVYTGPYRQDIGNQVREVDNHLVNMAPGCLVAVLLENYSMEVPWIGEVLETEENMFKIHYWKGGINKPWEPHMLKTRNGRAMQLVPYTDLLPKACVILCGFKLTNENKLTHWQKKYLREKLHEEAEKRRISSNDPPRKRVKNN